MKVIITKHFEKQMNDMFIEERIVVGHIRQYQNNRQSYENLGKYGPYIVCKDYLQGGNVRMIVFWQVDVRYFPISLVKKTSIKGKNIRKENIGELFESDIKKVLYDMEQGKFKVVEI